MATQFTVEISGRGQVAAFDEGATAGAGGDLRIPPKSDGEFNAVDRAVALSHSHPGEVVSVRDPGGALVGSWRDGSPLS